MDKIFFSNLVKEWETIIGCLCMIIISVSVFFATGSRYLLNAPLIGIDEIAKICFVWLSYLGASIAFRNDSHISIDALVNVMPVKLRIISNLVKNLVLTSLFMVFIILGSRYVINTQKSTVILGISYSYISAVIPLVGFSMVIENLKRFIKLLRLKTPNESA